MTQVGMCLWEAAKRCFNLIMSVALSRAEVPVEEDTWGSVEAVYDVYE